MTESTFTSIIEGSTSLFVYGKKQTRKGPGKKHALPFYNPAMQLNRDISIALLQWYVNQTDQEMITVLDGLAASGIRGIRMAHEIDGSLEITCNDWYQPAYEPVSYTHLRAHET